LLLILRYLKEKSRKKEIILSAYNFFAIPYIVKKLGFILKFVDVDLTTMNLDVDKLEKSITEETLAVVVTHTYGNMCNMDRIISLVNKYKLFLIEDTAHAFGAVYNGKKAGSFGFASFSSFSLTKTITTFFGGGLFTDDKDLYLYVKNEVEKFKRVNFIYRIKRFILGIIFYIFTKPNVFEYIGFGCFKTIIKLLEKFNIEFEKEKNKRINFKSIEKKPLQVQFLIGLFELRSLEKYIRKKIYNSLILRKYLCKKEDVFQEEKRNLYLNFPILVEDVKIFRDELLKKGIISRRGYLIDCSKMYGKKYPSASFLERHVLFIPNSFIYSATDMKLIVRRVKNVEGIYL